MISHAAWSNALKPLEILMRAVVTIVVSKAERNRQNHSPAMIVCSLAGLISGTVAEMVVGLFVGIADIVSPYAVSLEAEAAQKRPDGLLCY